MFEHICPKAEWCPREVLDSLLELAIQVAREGREGRRIGTLFTIGFVASVMRHSRPLILDPLAMHPAEARLITDPNLRGTIKELAQLDGAFILGETGVVVAACRYLDTSAKDVDMTFGLGSRHLAAASISRETGRYRGCCVRERGCSRFLRGAIAGRDSPGTMAAEQAQPSSPCTDT